MPKLRPGEQIGTQVGDGVGVETFQDIQTRLNNDKPKSNGRTLAMALNEVENYMHEQFGVGTRASEMAREQFKLKPKTRFQHELDVRAMRNKRAIDNRLKSVI